MTQAQRMLIREGVWDKFVNNYDHSYFKKLNPVLYSIKDGDKCLTLKEYLELFSTPSQLLTYAFDWSKSKEGFLFWFDLHYKFGKKQKVLRKKETQ